MRFDAFIHWLSGEDSRSTAGALRSVIGRDCVPEVIATMETHRSKAARDARQALRSRMDRGIGNDDGDPEIGEVKTKLVDVAKREFENTADLKGLMKLAQDVLFDRKADSSAVGGSGDQGMESRIESRWSEVKDGKAGGLHSTRMRP
ncbi:MAG: hypothetical protein CMJ34_01915 [Phycisphaerae bacterium]|nr:hypothetical protein [Phycisphaerae bacterium]